MPMLLQNYAVSIRFRETKTILNDSLNRHVCDTAEEVYWSSFGGGG